MSNVFGILRTTIIKISLFIILLKMKKCIRFFCNSVDLTPILCYFTRARARACARARARVRACVRACVCVYCVCVCVTYDISMSFVPTPSDATG